MISNRVGVWNLIFIIFAIEAFCLLDNWTATFKTSRIISSKLQILEINKVVLCVLLKRSFSTCLARIKVFVTQVFQS